MLPPPEYHRRVSNAVKRTLRSLRRHSVPAMSATLILFLVSSDGALAKATCDAPAGFPNPPLLASMSTGVNLPGWDRTDAEARPSLEQLQALRGEGFTHVRLPIDNEPFATDQVTAYVDSIYEQVILLLSLGYTVSLDFHPDEIVRERFRQGPDVGLAYLTDIWITLARMARMFSPEQVALELLNEPQIEQDDWMAAAGQLIGRLRTIVPDHTLIVGPSGPQRHEMLSGMRPFDDRNIIYAVHYYDPFLFTHQGANWGPSEDPLRRLAALPFPASATDRAVENLRQQLTIDRDRAALDVLNDALEEPWTKDIIAQAFDMMAKWSITHSRPVIVNEFGVLSFVAPREARISWLETVSRAAKDHCIGVVHWDFSDGFGLIDHHSGLPDTDIINAITGLY
jgi:endoglucanase